MTGIIVSAPGKVILFGEHAVVHGKAAVATAASDLRVVVTLVSIAIRLKVRVRVRLRFRVRIRFRVRFKVRVRVGMWGPFDLVFWCCWFSALALPIV